MEIKNNTIYHLPTEELKKDFKKKCEEQRIDYGFNAISKILKGESGEYGSKFCIFVNPNWKLTYCYREYYENECIYYNNIPIILWEIEKPKSKPTIIKLPNNHKIVINKPYTIYTDGKVTGKAKCNPEDEWNTEVGIQVAIVRYKTNRQLEDLLESVKPLSSYINPLNLQPRTIQERFPIGSRVEMVKASNYPITKYKIGQIATVIGHRVRFLENGMLVHCQSDGVTQVINPDDLRLING